MDRDEIHDKVVSGRTWAEFCDALKAAGDLVQERSTCDLDRIEGYRFLSRLARGGLYSSIETGDVRFPVLTTMPDQVKIGSDNPDSLYMSGNIDGRLNYRISGQRGTGALPVVHRLHRQLRRGPGTPRPAPASCTAGTF